MLKKTMKIGLLSHCPSLWLSVYLTVTFINLDSYKPPKENNRCPLSQLGSFANSAEFYHSGLFAGFLSALIVQFLALGNDAFAMHVSDFVFC